MTERRKCFGTPEYSKGSSICTGCENYKECGIERRLNIRKRKLKLLKELRGKHGK